MASCCCDFCFSWSAVAESCFTVAASFGQLLVEFRLCLAGSIEITAKGLYLFVERLCVLHALLVRGGLLGQLLAGFVELFFQVLYLLGLPG